MDKWKPKIHIPDEMLEENKRWSDIEQELATLREKHGALLNKHTVLHQEHKSLKQLVGEFKKAKERDWDGSRKVSKTEEDDLWDKIMQAIKEIDEK